jgi:hypothetical protein
MDAMDVSYHVYAGDSPEFAKICAELERMGQPLPNLLLPCVAWTAEDAGGRVLRVALLQTVAVVEPFNACYVDGEDAGMTRELFKRVHEFVAAAGVPRVLIHPEHAAMRAMAAMAGCHGVETRWMEWRPEWDTGGATTTVTREKESASCASE